MAQRCLSDEVHDRTTGEEKLSEDNRNFTNVVNPVYHYFGCVSFCERKTYFDLLDDSQKDRIRYEIRRVQRLRRFVEKYSPYKDNSNASQRAKQLEGKVLVDNVTDSLSAWRHFCEKWREKEKQDTKRRRHKQHPWCQQGCQADNIDEVVSDNDGEGYKVNRDMRGYLAKYKLSNTGDNQFYEAEDVVDKDLEKNGKRRMNIWKGSSPVQKATVYDLLDRPIENSTNHLRATGHDQKGMRPETLRYFHFPANNMKVCPQF